MILLNEEEKLANKTLSQVLSQTKITTDIKETKVKSFTIEQFLENL